jgi:2,4-dienoyl-CoA reductase (NADPH2)
MAPATVGTAPSMFDPIALGPVVAPNRLWFSPTSVGYAEHGVVTPAAIEHYGRRAAGGAGAVLTEHLAVSDEGWQHRGQPAAWPDPAFAPGLARLAAEIRGHGALAFAQISHAGRYAGPWSNWDERHRLAPSAVPFPLLGRTVTPHAMDTDQIAEVVASFAASVRFLVDAGFQGFEVHGGSGFLISGFLSPLMNRRTDRYGGSAANRVRFAQEVVAACVDAAAGHAVVGLHLMTDELTAGGMTPEDAAALVPALEEAGVEFIRPGHGTFETLRRPENAGVDSGTDFNRRSTAALLEAARVPIVANGGLRVPADVDAALAGGASVVALSRPMLSDPDWPRKARAGHGADIVGCPCNPPMCLQTQLKGAVCASWPAAVQEKGYSGYNHTEYDRHEYDTATAMH